MKKLLAGAAIVGALAAGCGSGDDGPEAVPTTTTEAEATTTTEPGPPFDDLPALEFSVAEVAQRFNEGAFFSTELTTAGRGDGVYGNELQPNVRVVQMGPAVEDLSRALVVVIDLDAGGQAEFDPSPINAGLHAVARVDLLSATDLVEAEILPLISNLATPSLSVPLEDFATAYIILDSEDDELLIAFVPPGARSPTGVRDI